MAHSTALELVSRQYGGRYGRSTLGDLRGLAAQYTKSRAVSILDAAAIGLAFDVVFSDQTFDLAKITPEMASAWRLAYPHVPIESLAGRSHEVMMGAVSGWKGKLFEVEVAKRLNDGEWVGDLHLAAGQHAQLAESVTQPGWDLQIVDDHGQVLDAIQLKATDSVGYIHEALARYPDTPILATHEAAAGLAQDGVIDSGISNDALTSSVTDHLADASSDATMDGVMGAMPLSIILATEAYGVLSGKKTLDGAISSGGDRVVKGAVAGTVAAAVSVIGTPLLGAIAGFVTRLALSSDERPSPPAFVAPNHGQMCESVMALTQEVRAIATQYARVPVAPGVGMLPALTSQEELALLADDHSRLHIESQGQPLTQWIRQKTSVDMRSMPAHRLNDHLADLKRIKLEKWIQRAIPAQGFFAEVGREMDDEYKSLRRNLDETIVIGELLSKKKVHGLTSQEATQLELALMSPEEKEAKLAKNGQRPSLGKSPRRYP